MPSASNTNANSKNVSGMVQCPSTIHPSIIHPSSYMPTADEIEQARHKEIYMGPRTCMCGPFGHVHVSRAKTEIVATPCCCDMCDVDNDPLAGCWSATCLVSTSIAPIVSWERNIQSCCVSHTDLYVPIFCIIEVGGRFCDEIRW